MKNIFSKFLLVFVMLGFVSTSYAAVASQKNCEKKPLKLRK